MLRRLKLFFNLSNLLSCLRVLLSPLVILVAHYGYGMQRQGGIIILIIIIGLTDFFDGHFARKYHQVNSIGKVLDPLCDKLTVIPMLVYLYFSELLPWWYLLTLVLRDGCIVVMGLHLKRYNVVMAATKMGKISICGVAVVIIGLFLYPQYTVLNSVFISLSMAWMILSLITYICLFNQKKAHHGKKE